MSSNNRTPKQKNAERYRSNFGLDQNDFGLNGQDFGLSQLKTNKKKQAQQENERRRSLNSNPATPTTPRTPPRHKPVEQLVATKETLEAFADDVATLWCGFGGIPVLDEPPSTVTFLRDYVSRSRPCIIRNALMVRDARKNSEHGTPASHLSLSLMAVPAEQQQRGSSYHPDRDHTTRPLHLSLDDIVDMDPNQKVVVDATPDGHGDCVRTVMDHNSQKLHRLFVTPEQRTMTLGEFRTQLREGRRKLREKGTRLEEKRPPHLNSTKSGISDADSLVSEEDDEKEEELWDELDGKRIYGLKGTQKSPRKKSVTGFEDFDDLLDGCTPTSTRGGGAAAGFVQMASCNPIGEMQEMMSSVPFFNDLMDGSNNKQEGFEVPIDKNKMGPPPPPPPPPSVLYYSRQNDCFRTELPSIYEATRHVIPDSIPFAEEAFGTGKPEAINLWMGDERAVSSMHKDPYENLFYVASGEKIFTLCPPPDAPYLYEKDFLSGTFDSQPQKQKKQSASIFATTPTSSKKKRRWTVNTDFHNNDKNDSGSDDDDDDDDETFAGLNHNMHSPHLINHNASNVDMEPMCPEAAIDGTRTDKAHNDARPAYVRWIEADVAALADARCDREQMRKFPLLKYAHPIRQVRVQAGELLYLPALWFHRVTQSRETIGINWWYNMNFCSPHWCYFQLMNQLQLRSHDAELENNHHHSSPLAHDDAEDEDKAKIKFTSNFPSPKEAAEAFNSTSQAAGATIRGALDTYLKNWD